MTSSSPDAAIVVGVDGSAESLRAVDWAAQEAQARRCPLRIVHAFVWPLMRVPLGPSEFGPPEGGLRNEAERSLSTAADRARATAPDLSISTELPVRAPAAALVAASQNAGLVVVGNRGLGGFTGLLLGSVSVQVASHAVCPVIVVRHDEADEPGPAAGHVVVGIDGSAQASVAVEFAFAHAARHGLDVLAVNVHQWPLFRDPRLAGYYGIADLRQDQERLLSEALAGFGDRYPDVPVQRKTAQGHPAELLLDASAGAALTVVGSRGRGGFTGLLLGSTSQSVLQRATGPVAVVRANPPDSQR